MSRAVPRGAADAVAELLAHSEEPVAARPVEDRDLVRVYLQPGQVFATAQPRSVMTILGSCVAICLCDPVTGVGGMNHYLLPHWAGDGAASPRFGNIAVAQLVERVVSLGGVLERLSAKIFGGACVLEAFRAARQGHLGEKNVQIAFRLLAERGIPVIAEDVGGNHGRKLVYRTDCGSAWVKSL